MKTKRPEPTKVDQRGFKKAIGYGTVGGTGYIIDELDDGATLTVSTPTGMAEIILDSKALMDLAIQVADMFGHVPVNPKVFRDKVREIVDGILVRNESRCLDDEVDRNVVAADLVKGLTKLKV